MGLNKLISQIDSINCDVTLQEILDPMVKIEQNILFY